MAAAIAALWTMEGAGMAMAEQGAKGPDGLPIIFWTIKQNDQAKVAALLDNGADIEAAGYHGATPILSAAMVDNWIMAEFLMQRGANIAAFDRAGFNLPYLTAHAKVAKGSPTEAALNRVRKALNDHGLLERIWEPAEVRALIKQGKWPPA